MQTREAAELFDLKTYQVKHLIRNGAISASSEMQNGIAYEFDYGALVRLGLAAQLLKDKYRLDAIRQALIQLDAHWLSGNSWDAGYILALENGLFLWTKERPEYYLVDGETKTLITSPSWPRVYYSVEAIAAQVESELQKGKPVVTVNIKRGRKAEVRAEDSA